MSFENKLINLFEVGCTEQNGRGLRSRELETEYARATPRAFHERHERKILHISNRLCTKMAL
jgi:hypothetical protein